MKLISHIIIVVLLLYIVSPECFDKNCLTCTDNNYGTCTSCATNFTLFYGSCVCYDPNGISCSSSRFGACVQCKPPFINITGLRLVRKKLRKNTKVSSFRIKFSMMKKTRGCVSTATVEWLGIKATVGASSAQSTIDKNEMWDMFRG